MDFFLGFLTTGIVLTLSAFYIGVLSIWEGYVLSILWGWFVVPTFGLPALTIPVAIGLSYVVAILTTTPTIKAETKDEKLALFLRPVSKPAFLLFFGWVVHSFFM